MKLNKALPYVCMVCGKNLSLISSVFMTITVDDCKPPRTRNRWRHVGYSCEEHENEANEIARLGVLR